MPIDDRYQSKKAKQRTKVQNDSLHLFFKLVAEHLNKDGVTVQRVYQVLAERGFESTWSMHLVKELWRLFQQDHLGKKSTTELNLTWDITAVYDIFNKFLSENFYVHEDFPSKDSLINKLEETS